MIFLKADGKLKGKEKEWNGINPCSRNASLCLYCPFEMLQATGLPNGEGVSVI